MVARHGRDRFRGRPGGIGPGDVGKVPRIAAPSWIGGLHRWSGRIAFLLAVPVAVQCLYALGFQTYSTRVLVHSLLGCAFFGAFTIKMLILPKRGLPGWVLPACGALVFTVLTAVSFTSAYWFFSTFGIELRSQIMAEPSVPASSRRILLVSACTACVAALAGCARYDSNNGGIAGSQSTQSSVPPGAPASPSSGRPRTGPPCLPGPPTSLSAAARS